MATPRGRQGYSRRKSRALVQATHQQTEDVNPKDFVRIAPVPSEHYPMSEVVARTSTVCVISDPPRTEFARRNHARRIQQINSQGFMSSPTQRYAELGPVEMNTKALIVGTLGQFHSVEEEIPSSSSEDDDELSGYSSSSSVGLRVPDDGGDMSRLTVDAQVTSATKRLQEVKLGRCLFGLVRSEEQDRLRQRQEAALEESKRLRSSWKPVRDAQPNRTTSVMTRRPRSSATRQSSIESSSDEDDDSLDDRIRSRLSSVGPSTFDLSSQAVDTSQAPRNKDNTSSTRGALPGGSRMKAAKQDTEGVSLSGGLESDAYFDDVEYGGGSGDYSTASLAGGNSSVQHGTFSRSTIDSIDGDDDDDVDLVFMHKYLCSIKWILDGMLLENLAALPPIIQTWQPMTQADTAHQYYARLNGERRADDEWNRLMLPPSPKKVQHQPSVQRAMRRARTSIPEIQISHSPHGSLMNLPRVSSTPSNLPRLHIAADPAYAVRPKTSSSKRSQKLSREQMEWLVTHVNQPRQHPRKEAAIGQTSRDSFSASIAGQGTASHRSASPEIPHDPVRVKKRFNVVRARQNLIAQTQLMAMERERSKSCQQKFEAIVKLKANGRLWSDLEQMRGSVETETAAMAKQKLLMNYKWFEDLYQSLPEVVVCDRLCSRVLIHLKYLFPVTALYVELGPERLDKARLLCVLAQLQVWERELPEVFKAIEFVRNQVIFVPEKEFMTWCAVRRREASRLASARRAQRRRQNPEVTELIQRKTSQVDEILTGASLPQRL